MSYSEFEFIDMLSKFRQTFYRSREALLKLIDQNSTTRYNQSREVPIVLLVGEQVGRSYRVPRT
jgi:hypothetical protein